jgi:hypothetical protein
VVRASVWFSAPLRCFFLGKEKIGCREECVWRIGFGLACFHQGEEKARPARLTSALAKQAFDKTCRAGLEQVETIIAAFPLAGSLQAVEKGSVFFIAEGGEQGQARLLPFR